MLSMSILEQIRFVSKEQQKKHEGKSPVKTIESYQEKYFFCLYHGQVVDSEFKSLINCNKQNFLEIEEKINYFHKISRPGGFFSFEEEEEEEEDDDQKEKYKIIEIVYKNEELENFQNKFSDFFPNPIRNEDIIKRFFSTEGPSENKDIERKKHFNLTHYVGKLFTFLISGTEAMIGISNSQHMLKKGSSTDYGIESGIFKGKSKSQYEIILEKNFVPTIYCLELRGEICGIFLCLINDKQKQIFVTGISINPILFMYSIYYRKYDVLEKMIENFYFYFKNNFKGYYIWIQIGRYIDDYLAMTKYFKKTDNSEIKKQGLLYMSGFNYYSLNN